MGDGGGIIGEGGGVIGEGGGEAGVDAALAEIILGSIEKTAVWLFNDIRAYPFTPEGSRPPT
jgi:hypothetical protein